jgi:hypothetical protein
MPIFDSRIAFQGSRRFDKQRGFEDRFGGFTIEQEALMELDLPVQRVQHALLSGASLLGHSGGQ